MERAVIVGGGKETMNELLETRKEGEYMGEI